MPRRTSGKASVHCLSTWHLTATLSVLCSRSTRLWTEGWWGIVLQRWIPHSFARLWENCYSKWRPSVVVCGQPKQDIQPLSWARDTVSAVISGREKASGQRVKRSTDLRQY